MGLCGNGASYDILKDAGVKSADLVVASTSFDETNILSCLIAQKLGAKSTIARVRSHEYTNQISILKSDLGITSVRYILLNINWNLFTPLISEYETLSQSLQLI